MGLNYIEFKDYVQKREINNHQSLKKVISELNGLYQEDKDFKFFYPRNIFNEKEIELIVFLNEGYLSIKQDRDERWIFEHNNGKVLRKTLITPTYSNDNLELRISFENNKELILKNIEDSNENWGNDYSYTIRELFKVI